MTDDVEDPVEAAFLRVLEHPETRPSTLAATAARLAAYQRQQAAQGAVPVPGGPIVPLTEDEIETLAGALHWGVDFCELWSPEQRRVCLLVGAVTQTQLDAADDAHAKVLDRDRRPASRDEVAARRGKRARR